MTISENCKRYQYFNFEIDFLESKNRFQKSGAAFLVENTSIQSCIISIQSCHTSEANVKTNEIVNTKCTYHKERSFASHYFVFLKILFQFKNLL